MHEQVNVNGGGERTPKMRGSNHDAADAIATVRAYLNANDGRYSKDWIPNGWTGAPRNEAEAREFIRDQWDTFPELHALALEAGMPDSPRRSEALHLLRLVYIDAVSLFDEFRGCMAYVPSAIVLIIVTGGYADRTTGRQRDATIIPFGEVQRLGMQKALAPS